MSIYVKRIRELEQENTRLRERNRKLVEFIKKAAYEGTVTMEETQTFIQENGGGE